MAAAQLAGAVDVEFHANDEQRRPAVSFLIEAATEHAALTLGHEVMRSVIGGKLSESVVRDWPGTST